MLFMTMVHGSGVSDYGLRRRHQLSAVMWRTPSMWLIMIIRNVITIVIDRKCCRRNNQEIKKENGETSATASTPRTLRTENKVNPIKTQIAPQGTKYHREGCAHVRQEIPLRVHRVWSVSMYISPPA